MEDCKINSVAQSYIDRIAEICSRKKPLVVIRSITYNHELYLRDALEGFVMQKTSFPFVAIVHDDCSTDGTASILREYAEKYPDIILPIFEEENLYSKHNGSISRILNSACGATGAMYVAMCEGDDYWTDPLKLQKQVDFLESHPDYSLVFHNARTLMLDGSFNNHIYAISGTREYSASEIIRYWTIPTASVVYRKAQINNDPVGMNPRFKCGDNVLFLIASKYGKLYGINEYWSVYRRNYGGVTVIDGNIMWSKTLISHFKVIDEVFGHLLEPDVCSEVITDKYIYLIRRSRNKPLDLFKYTLNAIKDGGMCFIKMAFKTWVLRLK